MSFEYVHDFVFSKLQNCTAECNKWVHVFVKLGGLHWCLKDYAKNRTASGKGYDLFYFFFFTGEVFEEIFTGRLFTWASVSLPKIEMVTSRMRLILLLQNFINSQNLCTNEPRINAIFMCKYPVLPFLIAQLALFPFKIFVLYLTLFYSKFRKGLLLVCVHVLRM